MANPAPLRLFLSYGHDANEELVRRIKADLEKRGHDVWFDKSEIKFGDDWRRSITESITGSHKFVSFLSKHSTRDPGVCRDEIAIALGVKGGNIQTILVESEAEVQPPVIFDAIEQWRLGVPPSGGHLQEACSSGRESAPSSPLEKLEPTHVGCYGTGGQSGSDFRLFWLMGAPGVGKSAVATHLAIHGREVIAVEFCNWQQPGHKNPEQIVRTLAFQIATRLPDYRKLLLTQPEIAALDRKNSAELFDYLLADPLHHAIDGSRERYLIVIDALDEAASFGVPASAVLRSEFRLQPVQTPRRLKAELRTTELQTIHSWKCSRATPHACPTGLASSSPAVLRATSSHRCRA